MKNRKKLLKIYSLLFKRFGPQHWWPGATAFEVMLGAILTQNTNWANVEKAINNLKREKLLSVKKLYKVPLPKLKKLIRPSGYYNAKAVKVKAFVKHIVGQYNGSLKKMFDKPVKDLRLELLAIHGIGPETADSMILYGAEKTTFVVDAYTKRLANRFPLVKSEDYHHIKEFFELNLPKSRKLYNEFHALIVALGKDFCRPKPICRGCPLKLVCQKGFFNT